jgi:8-oxo-dGTP diphosphatase
MLQVDSYQEKAVLCFIIDHDRVLLIEKKRGLGMGKINAPGGKVDPGESFAQAAIRETQEEVCLEVSDLDLRGALGFRFADGYSLYVEVFVTTKYLGIPTETPEAKPLWVNLGVIPYDKMWSDDIVWLPQILAGYTIEGSFLFDGDTMVDGTVRLAMPGRSLPKDQ